jgi:hypothetical protein
VRARLAIAVVVALISAAPQPGAAQGERFDHWATIESRVGRLGGIGSALRAQAPARKALADEFFVRAQFYSDLYEFQRELVLAHAQLRDSIARGGGVAMPAAAYYRARALHETGARAAAARAYEQVGDAAPPRIRTDAVAWRAALDAEGPGSWPRAVEAWRRGSAPAPPPCPEATPVCAVLVLLLAADVPALYAFVSDHERLVAPDLAAEAEASGQRFVVEFHDPLTFALVAAADYSIAARLYEGIPEADAPRAVALMRSGQAAIAEPLLRRAAAARPGILSAYHAEALLRLGRRADGARVLAALNGDAARAAWEVRGQFLPDTAGIRRYVGGLDASSRRRLGTDPQALGATLARALLRHGEYAAALAILDDLVPVSAGFSMDAVSPTLTVLLARARYHAGRADDRRDLWPLARGGLALMARDVVIVRPSLDLLQQLTAHSHIPDMRAR